MLGIRNGLTRAAGAMAALCLFAGVASAQPNDNCATPLPISGTGAFNFDTSLATNSGLGLFCQDQPGALGGIDHDLWYCWTADCTGLVTINTCGQTQVDTKIAMYFQGCACPASDQVACCNDDSPFCQPVPNLQSEIRCDVFCGNTYLIQIGTKPGAPGGPGTFTISCAGPPCPPTTEPCVVAAGQCCSGRPSFDASAYSAFGPFVTVVTASPSAFGATVLAVYDVVNPNAGPFNTDFGAPIYSHPSWDENNLGSIFGVTLDGQGNIYVSAASCYLFDGWGTLGGIGDVYKIDTNTGVASVFATLPAGPPALGQIAYDCANDQFFVSNMDDGKIYRLDSAGLTLNTFDFGVPDLAVNTFAPLGDRVWAVQPHNGRLYFSIWWENEFNPSAANANEIWSIALDGTGNFSGLPVLEISMPPNTNTNFSNPVADIRFTPTGTMMAAERGMDSDTTTFPHDSRLLEFECTDGGVGLPPSWVLSANIFGVGVIGNPGTNSAGGVDVDYSPGGRVYVTGDALQLGPQILYGVQGLPATGGSVVNSVLIDYNGNLGIFDKTSIGDVAVPCKPPCMDVVVKEVLCEKDKGGLTGCFDVTLNVTNNSGVLAQWLLIPGSVVSPNFIVLGNGAGLPNGQTETVNIVVCGDENTTVCFTLVLANAQLEECCSTEVCVDLPDCHCFQLHNFEVSCITGNSFRLDFEMQNLSPTTVEHLFFLPPFAPDPFSNMIINPNYIDVPTLPQFSTTAPINLVVTLPVSPAPGTEVCIYVAMHDEALEACCYKFLCFEVPQCPVPVTCLGDTNNDGVVNIDDMLIVIGGWGPCPPPNPPCPGDIAPTDGDRHVDIDDLLTVINRWGPCP